MSVGQDHGEEKKWELFSWQDQFQGAGAGSVETLILEFQVRHRTMISLEMTIARTPGGTNLHEVHHAPRQPPEQPSGSFYSEGQEPPISTVLTLRDEYPAAIFEVLSVGRLTGSSLLAAITPYLDNCRRRVLPTGIASVGGCMLGCLIPNALFVVGVIGPAPTIGLVLLLGGGGALGTMRLMDWAFPNLELLPDATTKTRWDKTRRVLGAFATLVVGAAGVLSLILTLNQG